MTARPPSGRAVAAVWLCAIALSISLMAGLLRASQERDPESKWLESPPFALVIGTSLMRRALPLEYPARALFAEAGNDDRVARSASPNLSDAESIQRIQRAIDLDVKKIFVEIDPLLRSFGPDQVLPAHVPMVRDFSERLRAAMLQLLFRKASATQDAAPDPLFDGSIFDGNRSKLATYDPVVVHAPRDPAAIAKALATARRRGAEIVWIAMPRTETVASYFGPAIEIGFDEQLQAFAAKFNATIWRPARSWPNEFFYDQAHLNAAGRARFLSELRLYLAAKR